MIKSIRDNLNLSPCPAPPLDKRSAADAMVEPHPVSDRIYLKMGVNLLTWLIIKLKLSWAVPTADSSRAGLGMGGASEQGWEGEESASQGPVPAFGTMVLKTQVQLKCC